MSKLLKTLFRVPFTLYFVCIEIVDSKKFLCFARKKFNANLNPPYYMWKI